jgi:hypothetical protein
MEDLAPAARPPDADPAAVAAAYLVSAFPSPERDQSEQTISRLRQYLPKARVVSVFLPGMSLEPVISPYVGNADVAASSFVDAAQACLKRPASPG